MTDTASSECMTKHPEQTPSNSASLSISSTRPGLDTSHLDTIGDRNANEADLIDQATIVPAPDELPPLS
jgi:hypothetical protein